MNEDMWHCDSDEAREQWSWFSDDDTLMRGIIWIDVDANSYGILLRLKIDGDSGMQVQ